MRLPGTGTWLDSLRLASGLTLFAFALTHFLNHALGLWSLEAMGAAQGWRLAVTRSPAGFVLLLGALVAHVLLALWKLARLRALRLRWAELAPGISGLAIAPLIVPHLFQTGVGPRLSGVVLTYPQALHVIYPAAMTLQTVLLLVVWLHSCLGLYYWLRGEPWWRQASHVLFALGVLIPAAALAGVTVAGREALRTQAAAATALPYSEAMRASLAAQARDAIWGSLAVIAIAALAAVVRARILRRGARIRIVYVPTPTVTVRAGPTLLEISRARGVPHLSVCGGKARCSTCRVRVEAGLENLPPPGEAEARLLRRIRADPDVRLACQTRPDASVTVTPLLRPEWKGAPSFGAYEAAGVDRIAAVLFIDIRGFTKLSEAKLAYDVVYILNSFFAEVGGAIAAAGGHVDKYMGDGVMAVFEHPDGLPGAARNAVAAVRAVDRALTTINRRLEGEVDAPLRVAMGLHGGRLVSGRVGWGAAAHPTVIGRVVNLSSRLESLAKARDAELALSVECAEAAGLDLEGLSVEYADIRGLDAAFPVALAAKLSDLAPSETLTRASSG